MTSFTVVSVSKAFSKPVLVDVSFEVAAGSLCCLRGENGSGKSTLLRCLAGDLSPDVGGFRWQGEPVDCGAPQHQEFALSLLGDPLWLPGYTVADHAVLLAAGDGTRAEEAMRLLNVHGLADQSPVSLSAGQAQRVSLLPVMLRDWTLLLLDEPERHLDAESLAIVAGVIRQQLTGQRVGLVATHSAEFAALLGAAEVWL